MQLKNDALRYGLVAQLFHWAIVALIITQFFLANKAEGLALGPAKIATLATHKSIGMTVFGLAVLRLIWRWFNPVPSNPISSPRWQQLAAHASHWALYGLILVTPLIGWLMSSARNFPVSWFGLFTLPDFVQPDTARYEFFHSTHEVLATALFFIAIVHAAAALKHHVVIRDNVLRRMLPARLKPE
ncbi:MAG TPA: cytochrome b [Steroidobacteraceae bacterium]|nr:cytochrome b [Steroidobacteraceae bacterium]